MSKQSVMEIIDRAAKDDAFRQQLLNDPQAALQGYDLTTEERNSLENLNEKSLSEFAGGLGDRSTKGWLPGAG